MVKLRKRPHETVFMSHRDLVLLVDWMSEVARKYSQSGDRTERAKSFKITSLITKIRLYNNL